MLITYHDSIRTAFVLLQSQQVNPLKCHCKAYQTYQECQQYAVVLRVVVEVFQSY